MITHFSLSHVANFPQGVHHRVNERASGHGLQAAQEINTLLAACGRACRGAGGGKTVSTRYLKVAPPSAVKPILKSARGLFLSGLTSHLTLIQEMVPLCSVAEVDPLGGSQHQQNLQLNYKESDEMFTF